MSAPGAVYGIALEGAEDLGLPAAPADWERWRLERVTDLSVNAAAGLSVWTDHARIGLPGLGEVLLEREARRIVLRTLAPLAPEQIAHPGLGPPAAVIAHWAGRTVLHGAAVELDGRAWGLLGGRTAGKSTTAELLIRSGGRLLSDDVLVIGGPTLFAGPPMLDLREDAAVLLGGTELHGTTRPRWRRGHGDRPLTAVPAGWVALEWGEAVSAEPLPAADGLALLLSQCVLPPQPETALLDLAALPFLRLRRPRDLQRADAGVAALLAAL